MEKLKPNKLFEVTEDQFLQVRKAYGATRETIDRDVDSLLEWFKMQPHLPRIELDREWLERLFIINKCLMERSKLRLDMIFASRNKLPDFFTNRNPITSLELLAKSIVVVVLPKLSRDNTRVIINKVMVHDPDRFDFSEFFRLLFMINEYRQHHDYCMGDRYIIDFTHWSFKYYVKMYPTIVHKAEVSNKKVFGSRVYGFHLVNPSQTMDMVFGLMKSILSAKLASRLYPHPTYDDLYTHVSREILPVEYGGEEKSCEVIYDEWFKFLTNDDFCKWIADQDKLASDESKRPGDQLNDDMSLLGMPGSFRKLNVD